VPRATTALCTDTTGADADPARQPERLETELHAVVADLERVLAEPASEGLAASAKTGIEEQRNSH